MLPPQLVDAAENALASCRAAGVKLASAESCTGGLVSAALTAIAGSSDVVERGFVTYSNQAKTEMLGVAADLIDRFGAVSEPVARAMAEGALANSQAQVAVAITGIAGPGGGSADKPVGLVHFACARSGQPTEHMAVVYSGNRDAIRMSASLNALAMVATATGKS